MSRRRTVILLLAALTLLCLVGILNRSPSRTARPTVATNTRPPLVATSTRAPASRCQPAPGALLATIGEGLTVNGGGRLVNGWTVRSNDFQQIHFLAASIVGPGLEDQRTIGLWAVNNIDNPTIAYAVNGAALEFSDWGDGRATDAAFSSNDDGAGQALDCARQAIAAGARAPAAQPIAATPTRRQVATPKPTTPPTPTQPASIVNSSANIRSGPGTAYPIISSASAGQKITIMGRTTAGDWLKLTGQGWIFAELVDNIPRGLPYIKPAASSPTATPVAVRAQPAAVPIAPAAPACQCSGVDYDCGNFGSWRAAQDCFQHCLQTVGSDVHRLDADSNGIACESLR